MIGLSFVSPCTLRFRRPVVGQSTPPAGLSGVVRRAAFRFSESQWGHWLLLILADRINAAEGMVQDLAQGRPPNPLVEMGLVPRRRAREAATATGLAAGAALCLTWLMVRRRR